MRFRRIGTQHGSILLVLLIAFSLPQVISSALLHSPQTTPTHLGAAMRIDRNRIANLTSTTITRTVTTFTSTNLGSTNMTKQTHVRPISRFETLGYAWLFVGITLDIYLAPRRLRRSHPILSALLASLVWSPSFLLILLSDWQAGVWATATSETFMFFSRAYVYAGFRNRFKPLPV